MGFLGSTDPDLFPTKIEITGYPRHHIQGSGGAPIKNNLSHLQSIKPLFQTVYLFAMKKFLLFAFAAVMYEGENETYIEASAENSGSILYDKEIRDKPRTRRTKRNV